MSFCKEVRTESADRLIQKLLDIKENQICFDCKTEKSLFCSVSHGSFICEACAGQHLCLSFLVTKSLSSRNWTLSELKLLVTGGNLALSDFFSYYALATLPIDVKYRTRAAYFYREALSAISQGISFDLSHPAVEDGSEVFEEISLESISFDKSFIQENNEKLDWLQTIYKKYPEVKRKSLKIVDDGVEKFKNFAVENVINKARIGLHVIGVGKVTGEVQNILGEIERYMIRGGEYVGTISGCKKVDDANEGEFRYFM